MITLGLGLEGARVRRSGAKMGHIFTHYTNTHDHKYGFVYRFGLTPTARNCDTAAAFRSRIFFPNEVFG